MSGVPPKPPRVQPRIQAAPKIRGVYYCDFWQDAHLPEFWKTRPVVIVSARNTLYSTCTVIPMSTDPQDTNPWAHRFSVTFDGIQSWAICNHPATVAASRLSQFKGRIPLVPDADFQEILRLLRKWIPTPRDP